MDSGQGVINTKFRAAVALVLTGWILFVNVHPLHLGRPLPWDWLLSGIAPNWLVAIFNTLFYGLWLWLGLVLDRAPIRKEEKAVWVASIANDELVPVRHLFPKIAGAAYFLRTVLCLAAFLAAVAILILLLGDRVRRDPGET